MIKAALHSRLLPLAVLTTLLAGQVSANSSQAEESSDKSLAAPVAYRQPHLETTVALSSALEPASIQQIANLAADWQLDQYDIRSNMMRAEDRSSALPEGWIYATLLIGLLEWGETSGDAAYIQAVRNIGAINRWKLGPRPYNADDHAIGQAYLALYSRYRDPEMLADVRTRFNWILQNRSESSLEFDTNEAEIFYGAGRKFWDPMCKQRWCWADAIFMAPPVWAQMAAITGDDRYLKFLQQELDATTDYLYNPEQSLYLRDSRFFEQRGTSGEKIYWGRGNGWVLAGLARMIEHLPESFVDKGKYLAIYRNMAERLVELQLEDGSWPSSLLEKSEDQSFESSGTGLLVYALAWGVNSGHLQGERYEKAIEAGWQSLVKAVQPDGSVGWVQQVAYAPGSAKASDIQLYGTGAVLLAAAEVYQLAHSKN